MQDEQRPQPPDSKQAIVVGLIWWVTLVPLYLLLASKLKPSEIGAGILAAALATVAILAVRKQGVAHFAPKLSWISHFRTTPGTIIADCGVVAQALWQHLALRKNVEGKFRVIPFDPGGDDARSAARRALVTAGITLGPNTYVIQVHQDKGLIAVHQLLADKELPGKGDKEWPL